MLAPATRAQVRRLNDRISVLEGQVAERDRLLTEALARITDLTGAMREIRLYAHDERLQAIRVVVKEALDAKPLRPLADETTERK